MLARLKSIEFSIRASYWFYPALFAIGGFVLAHVLIYMDREGWTQWLEGSGWIHPARPDGAADMLTVLAGSMIGVASTVFSITIAAVAYASGTYGPRLLTNFMEDKGNQLSLATFIGTFVYAISVLRAVRSGDEIPLVATSAADAPGFVPQLALLAAFAFMAIAVAVLVYFLHHIPSSIRINSVLNGIGRHALKQVDERFPAPFDPDARPRDPVRGITILAKRSGYIRVVDRGELIEITQKHSMCAAMLVRTGDFIHPGKPLLAVNTDTLEDEVADAMRACFALGGSRTPEQDMEFSIDELVEITLRALSPGINDPFTAITATHWLGALTAKLGNRDLRERLHGHDPGTCSVIPLPDGFDHYLRRGFGAARSGLATHPLAARNALDALMQAALTIASAERRAQIAEEANRLFEQAAQALVGPDLKDVRQRHADVARTLRQAG